MTAGTESGGQGEVAVGGVGPDPKWPWEGGGGSSPGPNAAVGRAGCRPGPMRWGEGRECLESRKVENHCLLPL